MAAEWLAGMGNRWAHTQTVGVLADTLRAAGKISSEVAAAAWLHDIGYAEDLAITGFHALDGALFLASQGVDANVVGLVAHHTGAAFEAAERGLLAKWAEMPTPMQGSLEALTLLDMVAAPDGALTDPERRIDEILNRYERSNPVYRAVTRSRDELVRSAARARGRLGLSDVWPAGFLEGVRET